MEVHYVDLWFTTGFQCYIEMYMFSVLKCIQREYRLRYNYNSFILDEFQKFIYPFANNGILHSF